MRLASFERAAGGSGFGAVDDDGRVADLATAGVPTLREALAAWAPDEMARRAGTAPRLEPAQIRRWLPPIPHPDKILCVGQNYRAHAAETGMPVPERPALFVRFAGSQVGHLEPTRAPGISGQYDYEAELAVVIGKGGRHLAVEHALQAVAGYACFAENSVRDFQRHSAQATAGKNFEASGAFGPWMVTADRIPDPQALQVVGRLNGVEMQNGPTSDMIFSVAVLVAYASSFARLVPGDVIVTGTPAGVGFTRTPPVYLKPGDVFEVEIPGVGVLRNPVAAAD